MERDIGGGNQISGVANQAARIERFFFVCWKSSQTLGTGEDCGLQDLTRQQEAPKQVVSSTPRLDTWETERPVTSVGQVLQAQRA